jgi:hypothetical protein
MAPPIPGLRKPVHVPHRTVGDVLIGLLAIVALAALTVGVPIALVGIIGLPWPHATPGLSVLTHQLDIPSILRVLSIVIWLAWLQLVWCVIVEIRAAVRNVGVPSRVPLAGTTQSAAHRLVTAALLLFTAGSALSPALIHAGPAQPSHTISSVAPGARNGSEPGQTTPPQPVRAPSVAQAPQAEKIYVVKPPAGRYHESLWEIAQNHLGDGRRYAEIYELNKDRAQPDGTKLTIASLIRPGWVLRMPRDAHGPGIEVVTDQRSASTSPTNHTSLDSPASEPSIANATPDYSSTSSPAVSTPTTSPSSSSNSASPGASAGTPTAAAPGSSPGGTLSFPYELSAASLLAAGVLAALGRRRREQLWRRAFGQRIAAPEGDAAVAESALRIGADEASVRLLDVGLRHLAQSLATMGRPLPTVFAAHIGAENLDLWVAPADPNPPEPWSAADGGAVWRLPVEVVSGLELDDPAPGSPTALAPYPGLVSIGTNETGRILVDLEVAHGLIAVHGPHRPVQAALAALAVELATNRWSDQMRITLVGFGPELAMIAPDRVTALDSLDEALPELEARAGQLEQALAETGADSVLTGRARGGDNGAWAPHYLIMAVPPTPTQRERLLALARTRHRTALGFVIAGDVRGATWTWEITDTGRLRADVLGFDLTAQLLPAEQYAAVVELFRSATPDAGVDQTDPATGSAPAEQLAADTPMPVEIGLLGPVGVDAPGPMEAERRALATELVVYLATHPAGVHPNVLGGAVWPRGAPAEVQEAALGRVRAWLGTDDLGRPNLTTDAGGRLRLGSQVRVDWLVFRALVAQSRQAALAGDTGEEAAALDRALALVRGQLLDGRDPNRYGWLATDSFEYEATAMIADTAHRLSALRLMSGDAEGAMEAARAGLRLAFNDEMLWRGLLLGASATGQEHVLRAVVGEVSARAELDEVMPRMAPETEALIDELLPSWRTSAA